MKEVGRQLGTVARWLAIGLFAVGTAAPGWATPSGEDLPQPGALRVGDSVTSRALVLRVLPTEGNTRAFVVTDLARLGNEEVLVVQPGAAEPLAANSLVSLSGWARQFEPDHLQARHGLALPPGFVVSYGPKPVIVATRVVPAAASAAQAMRSQL